MTSPRRTPGAQKAREASERAWAELLALGEKGWNILTNKGGLVAERNDGRKCYGSDPIDLVHILRQCRVLAKPERSAA